MSLNYNNLCDDWGWYIDIEKFGSINEKKQFVKMHLHDITTNYDNNEYLYYLNLNNKNLDYLEYNLEYKKDDDLEVYTNNDYINTAINIGTTAMITAILTYVILFL